MTHFDIVTRTDVSYLDSLDILPILDAHDARFVDVHDAFVCPDDRLESLTHALADVGLDVNSFPSD